MNSTSAARRAAESWTADAAAQPGGRFEGRTSDVRSAWSRRIETAAPETSPHHAPERATAFDAREASRSLARRIDKRQREEIFAEHGRLVEADMLRGLDRKGRVRLAKLTWLIETITDADLADDLDVYEHIASTHELVAEEIAALGSLLREHGVRRR